MKKYEELNGSLVQMSIADFSESYNQSMPASFPRVTVSLLQKFKDAHAMLFKHGDTWSLEQHRKRIIDWLPQNSKTS